MSSVRTFPIRLPPLPGEALDSWLEALAQRMHACMGDLLASVGLASYKIRTSGHDGGAPDWAVLLGTGEAAGIAAATGIPPPQVEAMTLARYDGTAVRIDRAKGRVNRHHLWGRATGSRYCPRMPCRIGRAVASGVAAGLVFRLPRPSPAAGRYLPGLRAAAAAAATPCSKDPATRPLRVASPRRRRPHDAALCR